VSGTAEMDQKTRQIMDRVAAALNVAEPDGLAPAQAAFFAYIAEQVAASDGARTSPSVSIVDHVGNYWRNWLLLLLRTAAYRPSEIVRVLAAIDPSHPISYRMLTLNLRILVRDGLVRRDVVEDDVNHVEYTLTALGIELSDWIMTLVQWAGRSSDDVARARSLFDEVESRR
jgi:DNA-binding HxlR family transcriptional regulator